METVTYETTLEAPPEAVRAIIERDLAGFTEAAGYDSVTIEGETIRVARRMGLATIELTLRIDEDSEAVLALDQTDGIFDRMWTEYRVEEAAAGSRIIAETEFTLGSVLGPVLDAALIADRRRSEFVSQFDYLADALSAEA
jgi:hypothetical protein